MTYSMHTQFIVHLTDELGYDGHDVPALILYSVNKGYPATQEEPSFGPTVSISEIIVDGKAAPAWIFRIAEDDGSLTAELLSHAADCDERAYDRATEARRDEALTQERGK